MHEKHHVLFNKREWEARPQYKDLRNNGGLIVPMEREVHNELHRNVQLVPTLGYHGIMAVHREFYRGRGYIESLDNLMFAVESAKNNERLSGIERGLAGLALEALDLQRPFIIEGVVEK